MTLEKKMLKKAILLLGLIGIGLQTANAQLLPEIGKFMQGVNSNPARSHGAEFRFPAYIKSIEVGTAKDGEKFGAIELGNDKLHGAVLTWGSTKLICLMTTSEAAKWDKGQKVDVHGKVITIDSQERYSRYANLGNGGMLIERNVISKCDFQPTQIAEPIKSGRVAEPGVSGKLSTASLCDPSESILFACNTGKKSVAVCSSAKGIQYRYGLDRANLDITVDAKGATAGEYPLAGGGVWYYRFSNGATSYVVYTAESSSMDKAGVVVEQGGKRTANLSCKNAHTVNSKLAGPAKDTKGFEVP